MIVRNASRPVIVLTLLALLAAASGTGLWRVATHRHALQARTQSNQDQWQAAADAQGLAAQQGDAVRDLVLATTPDEIRDAEHYFEALQRRYNDAQAALLVRFDADPETTAEERGLLAAVTREQLAIVAPVERVVSLARRNEDAAATRILVEQALPHEAALQQALARLGALQAAQNRAIERGSDTRTLERVLVAILGASASLLAATIHRLATRASSNASGASSREAGFGLGFGLGEGRAASNDDSGEARQRPAGVALVRHAPGRGTGSLDLSAEERARALLPGHAAGQRAVEVAECADGAGVP